MDLVERLLKEGVNPNTAVEGFLRSPFHDAISVGHTELVKIFIKAGATLNQSPHGSTALAVAASGVSYGEQALPDTLRMVKLLLDQGADVHAADEAALTAAAGFHLDVVKLLMDKGARPTRLALAASVRSYDINIFEFLLAQGLNPGSLQNGGRNLFHEAALGAPHGPDRLTLERAHPLLDRLLSLGVNPKAQDAEGLTPLYLAVQNCNIPALQWLLKHGVPLDASDNAGVTPLITAARIEEHIYHPETLAALIKAGAALDLVDHQRHSALDHAVKLHHWRRAAALLDAGARVSDPAALLTRLIRATEESHIAGQTLLVMGRRLVPLLKDMNAFQVNERCLLVWSALVNHPELTEFLIKSGADVREVDAQGQTALIWAGKTGADKIYDVLLKAGADARHKDASGSTAADWLAKTKRNIHDSQAGLGDSSPIEPVVVPKDDLFSVIAYGRLDEVKLLVTKQPQLLNHQRGGIHPVHLAAALGKKEIVEFLLQVHPSQRQALTLDGRSLMSVTIAAGQAKVVESLFTTTSIDHYTETLNAAARDAVEFQQGALLSMLLDAGWTPPGNDVLAATLQLAVKMNDLPLVKRLIPLGIASAIHTSESSRLNDPFGPGFKSNSTIIALAA